MKSVGLHTKLISFYFWYWHEMSSYTVKDVVELFHYVNFDDAMSTLLINKISMIQRNIFISLWWNILFFQRLQVIRKTVPTKFYVSI